MGRSLLIGNPKTTWREWLKANRDGRDVLCLDPSDPQQGVPGRLALFRGEHPVQTRFYGSLDPQRAPHIIVAALAASLPSLGEDGLVQLFGYRATPVLRQAAMLLADILKPDEILIAEGTEFDVAGLTGRKIEVTLDENMPATVQHAQRKAQWLRLIEECEDHEVDMREVALEGARLGSGRPLSPEERDQAGLKGAIHAEKCGTALFIVSADEPDDAEISRALDVTGCTRATVAEPDAYENLLCAFARPGGEEIGTGLIQRIDWADRRMYIRCTAVAPTRVGIVRLGSIRVDQDAREVGETRPWQI